MANHVFTPEDLPVFGKRVAGCPYCVRPSAYGLIRRLSGELAVARTAKGCFLPGGGLEKGEVAAEAVEREAMEECGLIVQVQAVLGSATEIVYSADEDTCFEKQSTFFEVELVGVTPLRQGEHELSWVPVAQACTELTHESHRWAARRLLGKIT